MAFSIPVAPQIVKKDLFKFPGHISDNFFPKSPLTFVIVDGFT